MRGSVDVGDSFTCKVVETVFVSYQVGKLFKVLSSSAFASLEGASVPLDTIPTWIIPLMDVVQPKRLISGVPLEELRQ